MNRNGTYKEIPIWGDVIPGNSSRSKLDDMQIDYDADYQKNQVKFALLISHYTTKLHFSRQKSIDTTTWLNCLKPGLFEETYTDVPGLVPFPVEGSDKAVIIIPGGGFTFTGDLTAPDQEETDKLAKRLNKRGISAFCLDYRFNPYKFPIPFLDLQRAVRWLKYHAADYGIDPDKIGLLGGSAGGYMVDGYLQLFQGLNHFPADYVPDDVDAMPDDVCNGGMFYPALSLKKNYGCLYATFPQEAIKTRKQRRQILEDTDLIHRITTTKVPLFLAHGTKDSLVDHKGSREFVKNYRAAGGSIKYVEVEGANHIFTNKPEFLYAYDEYLDWVVDKF